MNLAEVYKLIILMQFLYKPHFDKRSINLL